MSANKFSSGCNDAENMSAEGNKSTKQEGKRKLEVGYSSAAHESYTSTPPKVPCIRTGEENLFMKSGDSKAENRLVTLLRRLNFEEGDGATVVGFEDNNNTHTFPFPVCVARPPTNLVHPRLLPLPLGYTPIRVIEKGFFSTLLLAQHEGDPLPVVIKLQLDSDREQPENVDIRDELLIHKRLQHDNVLNLLTTISYQGRPGLVLEWCENGSLEHLLKIQHWCPQPESLARKHIRQLAEALGYIHLSGVAHRNLNLANILIGSDKALKIADFGHAMDYRPGDPLCVDYSCGTPGYQAPELVAKKPYDPRAVDNWALGSILYVMVVGTLPYGKVIDEKEATKMGSILSFPGDQDGVKLSGEVKELLKGLLAYGPSVRYTLNQMKDSTWMGEKDTGTKFDRFYLVKQPQKERENLHK